MEGPPFAGSGRGSIIFYTFEHLKGVKSDVKRGERREPS